MSQTIHSVKVEISAQDFVDLYGWGVGNIMGKFRDISIFSFYLLKITPLPLQSISLFWLRVHGLQWQSRAQGFMPTNVLF